MDYPARLEIDRPARLSRWLIFVKWLLAVPHYVVLWALGIAVLAVELVVAFAILFTARYPRGLFDFVLMVQRWSTNVSAYTYLLRDEYPPFSGEPERYPAVRVDLDYPERLTRWMPLVKWLLALPHAIVLMFLGLAAFVVEVVAWFAILITGRFPDGLFDFVVGVMRWNLRVTAYASLLVTDRYPPFSLR